MRFSSITAFMVRAVRQDSRSIPSLLLRVGLVGFLCWQLGMTVDGLRGQTAPGLRMFGLLMGFNLFVLFTAGVSFMAAAIAEEKEENTLGLLLLSGMGTLPVLLGKTISRLLAFTMLLTLQIPFTLLCVTLGGMRGGQVLAGYALLGSLTLLVSGIAVLASVLLRTVRGAVVLSGVLLLLWHLTPPFLAAVADDLTFLPRPVCEALRTGGAWMTARMSYHRLDEITGLAGGGGVFTAAEAFTAGAGLCFLLLAAVVFRLTESAQSAENAPKTKLGAAFSAGWARWFRPWRRPPAGPAALRWKDSWLLLGGRMGLFLRLATLAGIALWIYGQMVVNRPSWRNGNYLEEYCLTIFFISAAYAALSMFAVASRTLSVEFRDMTMADLLVLPGGAKSVVSQKTLCTLAKALPFLPFMVPGALVALEEAAKPGFSGEDLLISSTIILFVLLQILLQLELVAHLSLKLPRMAAAVSLPGHWIGLAMGAGILFSGLRGTEGVIAAFFLGNVASVFLIVLLHLSLPGRLHNTLK